MKYAAEHYRRPDGSQTFGFTNFKGAIRPVRELYGATLVEDFGPLALKAVRQKMLTDYDWSRGVINSQINRIRRLGRSGRSFTVICGQACPRFYGRPRGSVGGEAGSTVPADQLESRSR
jgi:hypothetical protein